MSNIEGGATRMREIENTILPLLRDVDQDMQGKVLASLLARWTLSHQAREGKDTHAYRIQALESLLVLVLNLMPIIEEQIIKKRREAS